MHFPLLCVLLIVVVAPLCGVAQFAVGRMRLDLPRFHVGGIFWARLSYCC